MKTNSTVRSWLPIALCCLPGVIVALAIIGPSFGLSLDGPFSGLVALSLFACPLTMFLLISRRLRDDGIPNESAKVVGCCVSPDYFLTWERNRLSTLQAQQASLDDESAELQASHVSEVQMLNGD